MHIQKTIAIVVSVKIYILHGLFGLTGLLFSSRDCRNFNSFPVGMLVARVTQTSAEGIEKLDVSVLVNSNT